MKKTIAALGAVFGLVILLSSCYVETRPMYGGGYRGGYHHHGGYHGGGHYGHGGYGGGGGHYRN